MASTTWTIREAWTELVQREHRQQGKAESSLADQRTHLRRWEEWAANDRSANPIVHQITKTDLRNFRDWLHRELAGLTGPPGAYTAEERAALDSVARNVNKHLCTVQAVLKACQEEDLIQTAPKLKPLATRIAAEKVSITQDEAGAIYLACDCAEWPDRSPKTVLQWRTAVVCYCVYGFRTQELIAYRKSHAPLAWSSVRFDAACPGNEGREQWAHGWLSYVPQKQKRKKPLPVIVPIHEQLRRHLDALRVNVAEDSPVFPWPMSDGSFYEQWERITRAAAERSQRPLSAVKIQQLRKTAHSGHKLIGGKEIAELITGHSPRSVSERHYDVPYGKLVEHFGRVVVPSAFCSPLPVETGPRQLRLF